MLNTEIGTYQIAEAIKRKPNLMASIDGRTIKSRINGAVFVGNYNIISKICDCSKVIHGLTDNLIISTKTPIQILDDVYGIRIEKDWEAVYDKDETWRQARLNATEEDKKHKQTKFTLKSYGRT